jgi:hypothetical protein
MTRASWALFLFTLFGLMDARAKAAPLKMVCASSYQQDMKSLTVAPPLEKGPSISLPLKDHLVATARDQFVTFSIEYKNGPTVLTIKSQAKKNGELVQSVPLKHVHDIVFGVVNTTRKNSKTQQSMVFVVACGIDDGSKD